MTLTRRQFFERITVVALAAAAGPAVLSAAPAGLSPDLQAGWRGPLQVGDIVTFAGQYAVNPITGKPTDFLRQFVVTDVTADDVGLHPGSLRITSLTSVTILGTRV